MLTADEVFAMPRTLFALIALLVLSAPALAGTPSRHVGRSDAARALDLVKARIRHVACEASTPTSKDVLAMGAASDSSGARRFVVAWQGDYGCRGGSGTNTPQLSIVEVGATRARLLNDGGKSILDFSTISKLVSATRDTVVLEAVDWGPDDANCCASVAVRATVKVGGKGRWTVSHVDILGEAD